VVPLFSLFSQNSVGIGEIPDLKLMIDWCNKTGLTILQLLPLNDVGDDFAPYSSVSTFAVDPMYLSIQNLKNIETGKYKSGIAKIKKSARSVFGRVNYKVKKLKLELLWDIYKQTPSENIPEFKFYQQQNEYWLKDYALFKVIKELAKGADWKDWNENLRNREPEALREIEINNSEKLSFHFWLQWQLYEQLKEVKSYAASCGVFIMGDLPFLVSGQSADVWSHQDYFMLELSAGAPPDMYFALGQKWGMPPYQWNNIANDGFNYLKQKLIYAENFYDMFRIDHFVGLFRVWVTPNDEELQKQVIGTYLPKEEYQWENHGRRIIDVMAFSTGMLPCAEDLGTVPGCSYHVLYEYGIPGIDFQRYYKEGSRFKSPAEYRINSQAVVSTHDSSFWVNWWQFEAGTIDEKLFEMLCEKANISHSHYKYAKKELFDKHLSRYGRLYWKDEIYSPEILLNILQPGNDKANDFLYLYNESYREKEKFMAYLELDGNSADLNTALVFKCIDKVHQSASVFSLQLLQEYLCLSELYLPKIAKWKCRINTPGSVSSNNWSQLQPLSLEQMLELDINPVIKDLATKNYRY
jgi:4-alpha-glucanotransferase